MRGDLFGFSDTEMAPIAVRPLSRRDPAVSGKTATLYALAHAAQPLSVAAVAQQTGRPAVVEGANLERLAKDGFVERTNDSYKLTRAGMRIAKAGDELPLLSREPRLGGK